MLLHIVAHDVHFYQPANGVGKMRNCGMRKVKCGIENCGNECGMVGKMWNAENVNRPV